MAVRLLDANGHQRYVNGQRLYLGPGENLERALQSPVFANSPFSSSSEPTQFTDPSVLPRLSVPQQAKCAGPLHLDD